MTNAILIDATATTAWWLNLSVMILAKDLASLLKEKVALQLNNACKILANVVQLKLNLSIKATNMSNKSIEMYKIKLIKSLRVQKLKLLNLRIVHQRMIINKKKPHKINNNNKKLLKIKQNRNLNNNNNQNKNKNRRKRNKNKIIKKKRRKKGMKKRKKKRRKKLLNNNKPTITMLLLKEMKMILKMPLLDKDLTMKINNKNKKINQEIRFYWPQKSLTLLIHLSHLLLLSSHSQSLWLS